MKCSISSVHFKLTVHLNSGCQTSRLTGYLGPGVVAWTTWSGQLSMPYRRGRHHLLYRCSLDPEEGG